jgi:acyl carrier protein
MTSSGTVVSDLAPLAHLSESDIESQLRGYPVTTVTAAKGLRSPSQADEIEAFLLSLLAFFLPAGTNSTPPAPRSDLLLRDELGLDSLALAEAMFKIEDLFGIRVENVELAELRTLADARTLLTGKLSPTA